MRELRNQRTSTGWILLGKGVLLWTVLECATMAAEPIPARQSSRKPHSARRAPFSQRPDDSAADQEARPIAPLAALDLTLTSPTDQMPPNLAADFFALAGTIDQPMGARRDWVPSNFAWQAPALCHSPLYFQDVNLERHGLSFGIAQPFVSTAHAFGRFTMLPYMMAVQPPHVGIYTLGYDRPGSCVPYRWHRLPLKARGVAAQAAAVSGLFLVIP